MKKQPSISPAGNEMAVASNSISTKTVKMSQPGRISSTSIATTRNHYSKVANGFCCCLLWSSEYTVNCISLYWEIKLAMALSLASRVRSMIPCLSPQAKLLAWDGFHYSTCWGTGQSPIEGCQQLNSAWGPLLDPMPWSCKTCLHRHSLWAPRALGEQQNLSRLGEFLNCCIF